MDKLAELPAKRVFDPQIVDFLSDLSRELLRDPRVRSFPDVSSYAFWIRRASLERVYKADYQNCGRRLGRGVSFHIAPSNVAVSFAVSFTSALLAGNACVVRVSQKQYEQTDLIVEAMKRLFKEKYPELENYLLIVRYEHDEEITRYLSSLCDVRVVWGGNRTISMIRSVPLPPRAIELTFADRHSIAVMNSESVLSGDIERLAKDFYTDTYYIDQNACSSPRIVIWLGQAVEAAQKRFWGELGMLARRDYDLQPIQTIDKQNQLFFLASQREGVHLLSGTDNYTMRILVDTLTADLMDYKMPGGFFFEYSAKGLEELAPLLTKPCQTIAYYGVDPNAILNMILESGARGGDRIVPVGSTMETAFKWDGYDLITTMSRNIAGYEDHMSR